MSGEGAELTGIEFDDLAEFYKIFGDPTRLKILMFLQKGEASVTEISGITGMQQSAVSHQLRLLKQSRLSRVRREGKNAYYSLNDEHIDMILKFGIEHILETRES